jgi:hypothetical protein
VRADAVLPAGISHFAALFGVYLVTGPLRARLLDGAVGPLAGAAMEAAAFAAASLGSVMLLAARPPLRWTGGEALAVGLVALAAFAAADALVAHVLCGVPLARHAARFATAPGLLQAAALGLHVLAPWLWLDHGGVQAAPASRLAPAMKASKSAVRTAASDVRPRTVP